MTDPLENLVERSVAAYKEGDYEQVFDPFYMRRIGSLAVDELVAEILAKPKFLEPLKAAFEEQPPHDDEIFVFAMKGSLVVTDQRMFQLDGKRLQRTPIALADVDDYHTSGFWRKRETVILTDGNRVERRTGAAIDPEVMMLLVERAKAARVAKERIDTIKRLPCAMQRLLFVRALKRVEALLDAHPERSALLWTSQSVRQGRAFVEQRIGLLPENAEVPEVTADSRQLQLMDLAANPGWGERVLTPWMPSLRLQKAIVQMDVVDPPGGPPAEASERAKGILEALDDILQACAELDPDSERGVRSALARDRAAAELRTRTAGWTDATVLAEDALGSLWPDETDADAIDRSTLAELLLERLREHRARLLSVEHPDADFIETAFRDTELLDIAGIAADKMALTLQDGDPHSILVPSSEMAVAVLTFDGSVSGARSWFQNEHGGYLAMLNAYLGNPVVADSDSEVFCHISFGYTEQEPWANVSLLPLHGERFRKVPIVAIDLLSEEEKGQLEARSGLQAY